MSLETTSMDDQLAPRAGLTITARAAALTTGCAALLLALAVAWILPEQVDADSYAQVADASGPGFFPLLAIGLMFIAGLWCLLGMASTPRETAEFVPWQSTLIVACCLAVVVIGLYTVGMLVAVGLMVAGLSMLFGQRRVLPALALGALTAIGIYLVFEKALKILFPAGWLF